MEKLKTIIYKQDNINYNMTFENKNGQLMVNATQLAKPFGKQINDFTRLINTKAFIKELNIRYGDSRNGNFIAIHTVQGGTNQGTWMCEELALKFAAWLSPTFDIWVQTHIKRLLKTGVTTIIDINTNKLSPIQAHLKVDEQKKNSKRINHKMYSSDANHPKNVSKIINYNVKSAVIHTGHTPKQLKSIGWQNGLRGKQLSSGKEVVRILDPSRACAMSLTDNIISSSEKLTNYDVGRIGKASLETMGFFQVLLDEGIIPHELKD